MDANTLIRYAGKNMTEQILRLTQECLTTLVLEDSEITDFKELERVCIEWLEV